MPSAANYLGNSAYWTDRVRREGEEDQQGYDWLLSADNTGFKSFISAAVKHAASQRDDTVRILHLGPGSSRLSLWLYDQVSDPRYVVHFDFAESAKELGERWERECWPDSDTRRMQWITGDLMNLQSVLGSTQTLKTTEYAENPKGYSPNLFDVLIDKGTLDAISCLEALAPQDDLVERIRRFAPDMPVKLIREPVYSSLIVALNLATVSRPGAAWVILSYGGTRFDAFTARVRSEVPRSLEELASRLWRLEVRRELEEDVKPSDEMNGTTQKPRVYHWVYLLRRTDVLF